MCRRTFAQKMALIKWMLAYCIHLLLSVYIEYYSFNTVFSFLEMCIHFLAPSLSLSLSLYIYIYILKCVYIFWHPLCVCVYIYMCVWVVWRSALLVGGSRDRFPVTGDFFRSIRQFHVPGVDSAPKNEYQDKSKDGRCVGVTTLPPSCAECLDVLVP